MAPFTYATLLIDWLRATACPHMIFSTEVPGMEFQQLKAFAVVAQHKNITTAARELNTTQPAVSKQLKKLECSYNIKLLIRRGTGVELTPEGVEFLKYVEPILETVQTLERRFSTLRNANSTSPLRIGGVYAIATSVLPALVDTFKKLY